MANYTLNSIEKEMIKLDAQTIEADYTDALSISQADFADVKSKICTVWTKVRKYVRWAEHIPFAGKFIKTLADVLDTVCD